jgi:hypothetical protein
VVTKELFILSSSYKPETCNRDDVVHHMSALALELNYSNDDDNNNVI